MLEPASSAGAIIDRHNIAAFLRRMIDAAEALPRAALHRRVASPAGISLELWFDDAAAADLYASRLAEAPAAASGRHTRLYVLHATGPLAAWSDADCDPALFQAIVSRAGLRAAYPFRPHLWLALDLDAGVGVQLARSSADLPDWHAGAPLRHHLHWLLRARGQRLAHAASLGRAGRGILFLGHGGSGKSGVTLAGLAAGLQTVGDDYLALDGLGPAVARPLFRIVKQDRAGLARIAGLAERTASLPLNWNEKVEFDPAGMLPGRFTDALRIDAIVLPDVAHVWRPHVVSIGGGEAMRSMMRSNLLQFLGEPEDGMDYYAALLRGLPTYRLELSDNAADNGAALADLIARLP